MSTANDLQSGLGALAPKPRRDNALDTPTPATPIPATQAAATAVQPKPAAGSSGIASPLTEVTLNSRSYYDERSVMSSDGIFVVRLKPLATLQMTDANGAPVVMVFRNPT